MSVSTPALILVQYLLSEEGRQAALVAGRNAGEVQTIMVRPPGTESNTQDIEDAVRGIGEATQSVAQADPQGATELASAVQALMAAVVAVGVVINPKTALNTVQETADPETWEALAPMADIDRETGLATLNVGFGAGPLGRYYEKGYKVVEARGGFNIEAIRESQEFDSFQTVGELVAWAVQTSKEARASFEVAKAERARLREANEAEIIQTYRNRSFRDLRAALEFKGDDEVWGPARHYKNRQGVAADVIRALPEYQVIQAALAAFEAAEDNVLFKAVGFKPSEDAGPVDKVEALTKPLEVAVERLAAQVHQDQMASWVSEHGSDHLQRLLAEGFLAVSGLDSKGERNVQAYLDERRALEIPNWFFGRDPGSDTKTPSPEDFARLDAARKEMPEAKLRVDSYRGEESFIVAKWLGHPVLYKPEVAEREAKKALSQVIYQRNKAQAEMEAAESLLEADPTNEELQADLETARTAFEAASKAAEEAKAAVIGDKAA